MAHVEQDQPNPYLEEYKKFSPHDRNIHLLDLFGQLPFSIIHQYSEEEILNADKKLINTINDKVEKRRHSQMRQVLNNRLEALISLSHTTSNFQHYIINNFDSWYTRGVTKEDIMTAKIPSILFKDVNMASGIFEPETAKEIERKIYQAQIMGSLEIHRIFDEIAREMGQDPLPFEHAPPEFAALLHMNPNLRITDPEAYEKTIHEETENARQRRKEMDDWPNAFFRMHRDEI